MFKEINIKDNESNNFILWDTHDIVVKRKGNNAEIVIHPCHIGNISVRYAKDPYGCFITLANGDVRHIDLGDEEDWGNVQQMNPNDNFKDGVLPKDWHSHIGWGNDDDGHIEIVKVEDENHKDIPIEEFKQDITDFLIYFEGQS